ncbi:MAG: transglycosylase domain-containing protein [Minisyncoccia bacterium]
MEDKNKKNKNIRAKHKKHKISFYLILSLVFFVILVVGVGLIYLSLLVKDLPSVADLSSRQISQSTRIYDRTGKVLLYEIGPERRQIISFDQIPNFLKQATLAAEDEKFYSEPAFNVLSIARALWADIRAGAFVQGGSTISQQLAKNIFLSPQKTITRKLKELILAFEIETKYTKDQILGLYLNYIPYGSNAYGVEAASQIYFNKNVKDINLSEAAIIASLPKAPTYYSPWGHHKNELMARAKYILERMHSLGFIDDKQLTKATSGLSKVQFMPQSYSGIKAPHFVLEVKDYLINKYGEDLVNRGGLSVITTLDWNMQQIAEKAVKAGAEKNQQFAQKYNASLVAEDPKTGQILALAGSRDFFATSSLPQGCVSGVNCKFEPSFNVATQGFRQPGSALKPFVYYTLFDEGYPPSTVLFDVPTEFASGFSNCPSDVDFNNSNPECFHPQDFEPFQGPISLDSALAQSINVVAVKSLYLAGLKNALNNLHKFGLPYLNETRCGLSLVLGGCEVKLIDLVKAYSVLAADGVEHQQSFILQVKDNNGNVLESYQDEQQVVAHAQAVREINDILSDVELRSGLFQNSLNLTIFPNYQVALKTGTSNDFRDAWAMGYTPFLVVGVWSGNNDNSPSPAGASILVATPIWYDFLSQVINNYPVETFPKPDPITPIEKPMLNGEYIYRPMVNGKILPQIHSILYYVDRSNPFGPFPTDPYQDSQFINWETGVINWARSNVPNFSSYNKPWLFNGAHSN